MKKIALALSVTMALGACTTTTKVSPTQPGDRLMTCSQMREEFSKLDTIKADAQNDQGERRERSGPSAVLARHCRKLPKRP
jgi:hypothetical protein